MYTLENRILYQQVDNEGYTTIGGIMNIIQNAIIMHSEDVGVGIKFLHERNQGWFLASYGIRVHRKSYLGENIRTVTNPYALRGMLGYRHTQIIGENDEVIAEADSIWVLMDLGEMQPMRISDEMKSAYEIGTNPKTDLLKIRPEAIEGIIDDAKSGEFTVSEAMIDSNGHMNNTFYVDVACSYLSEPFDTGDIYINYKKQLMKGEEVQIYKSPITIENGKSGEQIVFTSNGEIVFVVDFVK